MISVNDLTKLYSNLTAVSHLSFEVGPGEVLGLVGPNGAGKTTTLRCLCGIMAPSTGRIAIAGHDIQTDGVEAKRALAFIPDEPHLFDYLTVEEHLRFVARLYGVSNAEAQIAPLLDELELLYKRPAIASGCLPSPAALILDEPLTGLDPGGMRRMKNTIAARARAGSAVVLSSHLLHLVEELCTKLLIMRKGTCVAYGALSEIVAARPELTGKSLEEIFLALTGDDRAPAAANPV